MQALPDALAAAERYQADLEAGQSNLFGMSSPAAGGTDSGAADEQPLPDVREWAPRQRLKVEKETLGLYISCHSLYALRSEIDIIASDMFAHTGDYIWSSADIGYK